MQTNKQSEIIIQYSVNNDIIIIILIYRVSNMDGVDCKELLWLRFLCQAFLFIIFIVENRKICTFWYLEYKIFHFFQRVPPLYYLAHFWIWLKILKNEPNYSKDHLKFWKKFLFQISNCTHFPHKNYGGKMSRHQKWSPS